MLPSVLFFILLSIPIVSTSISIILFFGLSTNTDFASTLLDAALSTALAAFGHNFSR